MAHVPLADLWTRGRAEKQPFVDRAREAAELSLPHLAPLNEGEARTGQTFTRRHSLRAGRGVMALAAKMSVGFFPPTHPFFAYEPNVRAFLEQGAVDDIDDLVLVLNRRTRLIDAFLRTGGPDGAFIDRAPTLFEHLLVSGNYLLNQGRDGQWTGFPLHAFQVARDGRDRVRSILVRESIPLEGLPPAVRSAVESEANSDGNVPIFSGAVATRPPLDRTGPPTWTLRQEVAHVPVIEPKENVADGDMPWLPVRLFRSDGESYGRSLFDVVLGTVEVVEGLTQAIAENAAMVSRGVWRVDPNSGVDLQHFLGLGSGEAVHARKDEIAMVTADKGADLSLASNLRDQFDRELAGVFLQFVPRDAERVTAEEIRRLMAELNETFAGAASLLAVELQRKVIQKTERLMVARGRLDPLPEEIAEARVVTGLEAIGLARDEVALETWIQSLQGAIGPEATARLLKQHNLATQLAAAKGIDPEHLVRTEEELQAAMEQEAQARAVEKNLGAVAKIAQEEANREA